ncbi:hypothetical protein EYF80_015052 [Liparis tanakae]|uniref:Uncharacterized protein n=1 Tax=Liparis tanakae TaxID=230148 RepID=A0A4Z2IBL4_9TELE|nr:hypothetical protein EYF80_015052 [Liparis tanakae]
MACPRLLRSHAEAGRDRRSLACRRSVSRYGLRLNIIKETNEMASALGQLPLIKSPERIGAVPTRRRVINGRAARKTDAISLPASCSSISEADVARGGRRVVNAVGWKDLTAGIDYPGWR